MDVASATVTGETR